MKPAILLSALVLLHTPLLAQVAWVDRMPAQRPLAEDSVRLVYVQSRMRTLLFGGLSGNGASYAGETWEWNGSAWTKLAPVASPSPRAGHAMAYDVARDRVVLYGGHGTSGVHRETWEWDGTTWTLRAPPAQPSAEHDANMVYDSLRGRVVLFGGFKNAGTVYLDETWEWDGTTWTQVVTAVRPRARVDHAMAFDSTRGRVVLYGGWNGGGFKDTWEYDGASWIELTPSVMPLALDNAEMAYDGARCRTVLFGGGVGTQVSAECWTWDGSAWSQFFQNPSPAGRVDHAMAFDRERGAIVLYGGYSPTTVLAETWEMICLNCSGSGACRELGQGMTSGGSTLACLLRPAIGQTFAVAFNGSPTLPGFLVISSACAQPPIRIGPPVLCTQGAIFPNLALSLSVPLAPGVLSFTAPIPNGPWLLAAILCLQAGQLSGSCLVLSSGIEARIVR